MSCVRKIVLYRFGLVAILSSGLGFMTVAADHQVQPRDTDALQDLRGPVHALDEVYEPQGKPPSNWI